MSGGYYYSDDPRFREGVSPPPQRTSSALVSPAPTLTSSHAASRSRLSSNSTPRDAVRPPPSYDVYRQYPRADAGSSPSTALDRTPSGHLGTRPSSNSNGGNVSRRTSATYQPISFNTGGGERLPAGYGRTNSSSGVAAAVGTPSGSSGHIQSSLLSPPSAGEEPHGHQRAQAPQQQQQQRVMISPTLQDRERPRSSSSAGQWPSGRPQAAQESRGYRLSTSDGAVHDDRFALSGVHYTPFTPPSSGRGHGDDRSDDFRRQRSDRLASSQHSSFLMPQQQQQQPPPPLPSHRLIRESSGSLHGLPASPSLSPQHLGSSGQSGQNGQSARGLVSPRTDGPTFVDPEGNHIGAPQRGPVPYRKAGSYSSVGGHSDDPHSYHYGSPYARSKSLSEANSSRMPGASRRDDGSSLEGSSRRGSFQTSPSLQRRESFGGAGGSRTFEAEGSRTVYSRLSSPGMSFGFGSPTSTGERSLNRGTGGVRTPRFGESGATTPRALSFQRGRVVGSGGFGTVFQAILSDGTLAAVKELKLETSNLKAIDREVHTMSSLPPHANCVRYFGSRHSKNHYYIIMEYISGGSIHSLRQSVGRFRESVFQRYAWMVLLGLEHLHTHGIIHRDIKGANVLLDERGCAKIVDFGCCKDLNQGTQTLGTGGTPLWMAPEVCRGEQATVKSDVWAFGCLCLEMTNDTGLPWSFPPTMTLQGVAYALASAKNPPPIPTTLSDMAQDFIACCLRLDPEERLDVPELLNHPFFDLDYEMGSGSDDELIVSREPSARESAVKRMMKHVNETGEGFLVPQLGDLPVDALHTADRPLGNTTNTRGAATRGVTTCGTNPSSKLGGGATGTAAAASPHQTVNMGFRLDAVDEDSKDSSDAEGLGGAPLRPMASRGTGGAEAENYAEDPDYMATVNDIISRARKSNSSHGLGPAPRSSTATGGHPTTGTNTTATTSPSRPRPTQASQLEFSSSTSSSTFMSSASSSSSSSASSSPRLVSRNGKGGEEDVFDSTSSRPPDLGYTKAPASRRVYEPHGDSPEPESLTPREPEGGTRPKPSRVSDPSALGGSAFSRTSTTASSSAGKTFQRRTTFPVGSTPSSATADSSRRQSDATARSSTTAAPAATSSSTSGKPPQGLSPGGPSRVGPADPTYPTSDGVSKARSFTNSTRAPPTGTAPSSTIYGKSSSTTTTTTNTTAAQQGRAYDMVDRGDTVFTFSSGSQGFVAPTKKPRSSHSSSASLTPTNGSGTHARSSHAAAAGAALPSATASGGVGNSRVWESSGRNSISKELTSAIKEVKDIISHTRTEDWPRGDRRESGSSSSAAASGEKKKSKWFSR